ncbi:hypothetical protein HDV02_005785 [Globomyces sp. JEL0801]|nr:hypothetical protein HDV02_005785 [Globomyces sp. JEL0801]
MKKTKKVESESEDEWIEKDSISDNKKQPESRAEWMSDSKNIIQDIFNSEKKVDKKQRIIDRELEEAKRKAIVDERTIKPVNTDSKKFEFGDKGSSWRMMKLKRVFEIAKEDQLPVEQVAVERFGNLKDFQLALDERKYLDDNRIPDEDSKRNYRPSFRKSNFRAPDRDTNRNISDDRSRNDDNYRRSRDDRRDRYDQSQNRERDSRKDDTYRRTRNDPETIPKDSQKPETINRAGSENKSEQKINTMGTMNFTTPQVIKITPTEPVMTNDQLNRLNAKVIKAKLMKAANLEELEEEYVYEKQRADAANAQIIVVPSDTNSGNESNKRIKLTKQKTHDSAGNRISYLDENEQSLDDLVRQEKINKSFQFDKEMANQIAKDSTFRDNLDYMDDRSDNFAKKKVVRKEHKNQHSINDFKRVEDILANCHFCYQEGSKPKVSVVAVATKTYLALPETVDMVPYHCLIVPMQHAITTLELEDDTWDEIREALLDAEGEFSQQHKKLIPTSRERGFRKSLVPNLPYFHIWFDPDQGLGHIIEDPHEWQPWFGKQVIAGPMDLSTSKWRKPKLVEPNENSQRIRKFLKIWSPFNWTKMLHE